MVRGKAMTKHAGQMDARIAAAFTDSATSDDVGGLLAEVEAAVNPSSATPSSGASLRTRAEVIAGYGKGEGDLKVLLYAFLTLIPVAESWAAMDGGAGTPYSMPLFHLPQPIATRRPMDGQPPGQDPDQDPDENNATDPRQAALDQRARWKKDAWKTRVRR